MHIYLIYSDTALNLHSNFARTVFFYADDIVIIAACWQALQTLLLASEDTACKINM